MKQLGEVKVKLRLFCWKKRETEKMLFLLVYLSSISLHLYFFIPLSPISIYKVNDIKILNIICYLNISEKIKRKQMFGPADLEVGTESVEPSGIDVQPLCRAPQDNLSPTHLLLKLLMFIQIMPLSQSS